MGRFGVCEIVVEVFRRSRVLLAEVISVLIFLFACRICSDVI